MRVAFPYMGDIHLILEPILRNIGVEVIKVPPPNKETIALGTRLAPETICFPFKATLGNMLRAMELGADTLIYVSGSWSCRFGYYGRLQVEILRDLGYRCRFLELRRDRLIDIVKAVITINQGRWSRALFRSIRAFRLGWWKAIALERNYQVTRSLAPLAQKPDECFQISADVVRQIEAADTVRELKDILRSLSHRYAGVKKNGPRYPLRVKLIGESYCTIEPYVNFNIIAELGKMGVLVDPFLTGPRWIGFHGFRFGKNEIVAIQKLAQNHWRYSVGGEDANSVGHLILAAREGYDGVIHIHPFACMPSTVVQPTLRRISQLYGIPFLSLSVDEHTAVTGFLTRVEAFVSLLERQRGVKLKDKD